MSVAGVLSVWIWIAGFVRFVCAMCIAVPARLCAALFARTVRLLRSTSVPSCTLCRR